MEIKLHPLAKEYLFKYYRTLRRIFSNVRGQLETDYISIALIDKSGQICIFSSNPSLEQNLLEKDLWESDRSLQPEFIFQNEPRLWSALYNSNEMIYRIKQEEPGLSKGIVIPVDYAEYRAVFSFGFKYLNPFLESQLPNHCEKLLALGKFCLNTIIQTIPLPNQQKKFSCKPHLRLVTNNKETYDDTIR